MNNLLLTQTRKLLVKNSITLLLLLFTSTLFSQSNNCAATPTLSVGATCVTTNYNVEGTFTESGVTASCGTSLRDGWFTFTTGATTTLISVTGTSNRRLGLAIYSGACGTLTEVACTIPNNANASLTNISVSPSTTYRLRLMRTNGPNSNDMTGTICVVGSAAPSGNFTCATATALPCGTTALAGTTVGSTGATAHGTGCSMSNYGAWYTFVGDGQITTVSTNPSFDIKLSVATGSCGSLTNIACTDSSPETATFSTTLGTTYYVYIAHWLSGSTTTGTFTISRACSAPIANDNCAGAVSVPVNPTRTCTSTTAGTIFGATDSGVTGSTCGGTDDDDVWFSFVATAPTHYIELLNVAGSTTDLYHAVYAGSCASLGAAILCSDPNTSTVTGLTIGNTYFIQVYSWTSTTGQSSTFDVCVSTDPACAGTPIAGATTTSPGSGAPGSSYTVSATGYSTGVTGLTFQWQYSTNGGSTWTNQGAATGTYANYTATAPALGTTVLWHLIVTCTNSSLTATSSNGTFTSVSTLNVPASGNNSITCGTNTALYDNGGISANYVNNSNGYTVINAGTGATINISGNYNTESIDYIRIYNGSGTGGTLLATYSGTGSINYTGTVGQTLTVQFTSDSSLTYSGFTLSVTFTGVCNPVPCTGTPTGGTVTTSPNTGWPGTAYIVSATGYTQALNMTYQWQYSTDAGATWTNAGAATASYANYSATAPASGDVHWQLIVTCTNSSQSATSSTGVFVTMTVSVVETGCPNVVSGGLGLSGSDPAPITCISPSGCVDLEATYLDLGETTSYIVEPIAYNPPFSFSGLANPVSVNTDDVWSPIINLPFDFCFYDNTYNQCVIGSNGVLTFNTSLASGYAGYSFANNIPISGDPRLIENSIFGVFHDINPGVGGEVGWELITLPSGCRALVASWSDVPMFDENSILYTGMMVLYENSNIIEVYIQEKNIDNFGAGTWNDGNAVVGIQNSTGTLASVPPGRNGLDANWTATNEAWRFVPNGNSIASITWYEGSGVSGTVVGTTDVINVCPASTTTYTAEITYTLCDGRTITELDETTVTVNKDKTWDGSTSTDWNVASNWTPSGVPLITESVFIPNVANDPIIGAGADALACSLNVEAGAVLTINSGRNLVVTNGVTVAAGGTLNVQNTANLVQVNDSAINSGNINMERITNVRLQDYSYWSSPVESFPVQNVSPLTPAANIFEWGTTAPNANGGEGTWLNTTESMIPAKGYILRAPAGFTNASTSPLTANFVGVPNNGIFTPSIFRGTNYTTVGTQGIPRTITDDNWNLIGNPYPSALGVNEFLTLPANNTIVGGIRIWTHGQLPTNAVDPFYQDFITNYYPSDYITINLTGATSGPGDYKIGSGQGFMVLMNPGTPGSSSVTFNNSMRSASFANNQFYRNSTIENNADTIEQNRIWLDLVGSTGAVNRMLVGYVTNATQDEDALYDSFTDYKPSQNFYSLIGNDPMSIQGRALPFNVNDRVNLGVTIPQDGTYNIAISALDGLFETTNQNIYIEDLENNIIHNLKDSPYTFTAAAGNITTRFILRYTENRLSNDDLDDLNNNIFVIANDYLSVKSTSLKIKSITIHDILGRIISDKKNVNSNEISFGNIQKSNTTLLVKIQLINGQTITKKVIF